MMVFADVSRKQAFLTHLAVSACVFVAISYLIIFHWFPDYYFYLDGGMQGVAIIFFINVVPGPGLTLMLFKPGKRGLKFDMAVVLLLQFSALVWGVKNIYTGKSEATISYLGAFTCVTQNDTKQMDMQSIAAGPSGKQRLSFLQRPDTINDFLEFTKEAFAHGSSAIYYYGERTVPLDKGVVGRLSNYKINLTKLALESEAAAARLADYIARYDEGGENIHLLPLSCRYGSAVAVYDTSEMKIVDLIDIGTSVYVEAQDEPLPVRQISDNVESGNI